MSKHTELTKPERVLLFVWKNQGLSNIECAKRLGRDKSTIGRELKRNSTKVRIDKVLELIYEPNHAHFVTIKSKKIYRYVMKHLREGKSPEQIAGRLKFVLHPDG